MGIIINHSKGLLVSLLFMVALISLTGCPNEPNLQVSALTHHFGGDTYTLTVETDWSFQVWNAGEKGSILTFEVEPQQNWITVNPTSGRVKDDDPAVNIAVHINRDVSSQSKNIPSFATGYIKVSGGNKEEVITVTTVPNLYTEIFGGLYNRPFDLSNTTLIFIPYKGGLHFYKEEIEKNVQSFPEQSNSGNFVYFPWQDPFPIRLGVGSVRFYDIEYKDIYVSSRGYIAFGSNGLEPTTIGKHFAYPQISLLPVDALQTGEGSVSYIISPQKLVITWKDIPLSKNPTLDENNKPFKNNFQVELFYDGTIQITYLSIDPNVFNAVIGLSCGGGDGIHPPMQDFVISNLSDAP
ncbi:MAG TPA: hypothetical protein PLX23_00745 [Candidatus Hydrogenedens sp.]|nr:hypothetical protein [Candidatus Hydrogenedens sp.]